jgi:hypothetical protein
MQACADAGVIVAAAALQSTLSKQRVTSSTTGETAPSVVARYALYFA